MACPFAAYNATFTCVAAYCKAPGCCVVNEACAVRTAYPATYNYTGGITDTIDVIHDLPDTPRLSFRSNGITQVGMRLPGQNASTVATLTANVESLSIQDAIFNVSGLYLPRSLKNLTFENSYVLDNNWPRLINERDAFWPPNLTHISLRNNGLLSFADATSTTPMAWPDSLVYLDLSLNLIETFVNLPFVQTLNMSYNRLQQLQAMDLTEASILDFSNNPYLTSLDVTISPNKYQADNTTRLRYMYLQNTPLVSFSSDVGAYHELEQARIVVGANLSSLALGWGCETLGHVAAYANATSLLPAPLQICVLGGDRVDEIGSSLGAGAIAGIVAAAVALLSALCLYAVWYRRRRTQAVKSPRTDDDFDLLSTPWTSDQLQHFRLEPQDVRFLDTVLGQGSFGRVRLATYKESILVAVKQLRSEKQSAEYMETLLDEIELMTRLCSPHLVGLVGVFWDATGDVRCVMEYMAGGDLQAFLYSRARNSVAWSQKAQFALEIARGLVYLHATEVIHRDLKSRNVLLTDAHAHAKLADFGIARHVTDESMTNAVGTYRWTAPEVLKGKHYDTKADIYSFGMVLAELETHAMPYADFTNARGEPLGNFAIMYKVVMQGKIAPTLSSDCPPWLETLVLACIAHSPALRPTATEIVTTLDELLPSMCV
ncbi:serine/threonine protein kinase [Saprolegnia diclina VS20]|uniref:Serine/threonine protein kinase n=1 Tax=Saprolegnia diclina (strain VS20) TaxID=1156394 RepID=T0QL65_SAPDV|nr:serine/threonine protein kinase [Saprolegnia diclina VS20]EQC35441.1 serine/threonine protein kinase [Saprolegnia diclina VS20]|eukprot:XP_008611191.1 serine/threonine protein kinase [Saprolegnia diclina VS20]